MLSMFLTRRPSLTSRRNPIVARYRSVAQGDSPGLLLLDGVHLIADALAAGITIEHAVAAAQAGGSDETASLITKLSALGVDIALASTSVMDSVSPLRSSSAIVAIARRPEHDIHQLYDGGRPLVLI